MTTRKLGPVSAKERREYRSRYGGRQWNQPTPATASSVWTLLAKELPVQIDSLMPKRRRPAEDATSAMIAKQSFLVALDCALVAGADGRMLTLNSIFDSLARRWSVHFRRAMRGGAGTAYDMREETIKAAWRDLLCAGVRIDTLWSIVAGRWSQDRLNPLYSVARMAGKDRARGWRVSVN